jgi:AcrR family transcriptional regulator
MEETAQRQTSRWHPDGARRDVVAKRAARLFAERGYHGASLRDIAAASGIRSPTLYSHYPSKLSIFVEVVNRYFDAFLPRLREAADGEDSAAQRVGAMLATSVEVGVEWRDEFLATSNNWEWVRSTPELTVLIERRDEAFGLWRSVLADGAADGSLRDVDPFQTLWIISSAITGMVDQRYVATAEENGAPPTGTLVDILLGGLATRGPR